MKKITIAMLAMAALPLGLLAQDSKKEKIEKEEMIERKETPEAKERPGKKETQEIIIRQNGNKEIKLKVEIDGDKITVNDKPLDEFTDKNITINKRKMTINDGNNMMTWNFSGDGEGMEHFGRDFGENFEKQWEGQEEGKGAFLGVTTETSGDAVKIVEVVKGSAAEKAGLKKDDLITKVGDEKITSPQVLADVIGFKKPEEEIRITYKRNGKENTVKTTLGKKKRAMTYTFRSPGPDVRSFSMPRMAPMPNMEGLENFDAAPYLDFAYSMGRKKIGLKLQDTEEGNGVKVINVEDSTAAATAGIKKDDVITEIDGKKVANTDDAREQLAPDEEKRSYKIKVNRNGSEMTFDVKIPRKLKTADL